MIISTRAAATALAISLASSSSNNHHYRMAVAEMVAASTSSSSDNNASMEESSEDHQLNNNEEEEEAGEIINVEEVDIVIPNNEVEIDIATTASLEEEEEKSAEKSSATDNRHYEDERSEDEKDAVVVQAMIDGEGDEGNVVFYGNHTDTDYADADAEDEEEEEDESDSISTTIITSATERDLTSEYKTLPTTYCCKGNRGASNGMMFNLKPKKRLILHEMSFHTWMTGAVGIEVWVKKGNYRGYEQKPGSWTKWVTNTQVIGRGTGAATRIPPSKFGRMAIEIGEMRGFYIRCAGASSNACLLSSKQGYKAYSNDELTYYGNGSSKRITWNGSTIMPRTFNGQFRYEVASSQGVGGREEPGEVALLGFDPTPPPTPKPTPRPTFKPVAPTPISGNFRLRLYWEERYYWQETTKETFWCMETSDSDEGDSVYIDECKSDKDEQRWVKVGNTFRPNDDTSLCMTTTGTSESNPIRLYKCDGRIEQEFLRPNLVAKNVKFQMKPEKYGGSRCLTQQHHPKADERVYPEECAPSERDTTSYWITY